MLSQGDDNQGNDVSTGNFHDENNTGYEAHGRTFSIGIGYTRRNSNTKAWMGSYSLFCLTLMLLETEPVGESADTSQLKPHMFAGMQTRPWGTGVRH